MQLAPAGASLVLEGNIFACTGRLPLWAKSPVFSSEKVVCAGLASENEIKLDVLRGESIFCCSYSSLQRKLMREKEPGAASLGKVGRHRRFEVSSCSEKSLSL